MTETNGAPTGVPRWHAMVAGATATLLAWWLRPCALHDESLAVLGLPGQPAAIASASLAQLYRWLVGWLAAPLGLHAAAQAVSAIAVGVATSVMHRVAAAAGAAPRVAWLAAGLFATCPAVALAATQVHVHGLVVCIVAVAAWLAVSWARRPGWSLLVALGVLGGIAWGLAPVGALLLAGWLPWLLLEPRAGSEPGAAVGVVPQSMGEVRRRLLAVVLVTALATAVAAAWLGKAFIDWLPSAHALGDLDLATLLPLFLRDAGRAFLPLSLLVLGALWSRDWHRHALLLLVAALGCVSCGAVWTVTRGDEGSFVLPLLPAALLLVVRWLAVRPLSIVLLVAVLLTGTKLGLRADWAVSREFAAGVLELAGDRPIVLIIGPVRDEAFVLARLPEVAVERVVPHSALQAAPSPLELAQQLAERARGGTAVLLTAEADAALRDAEFRVFHPGAKALLLALEQTFESRVVTLRGFAGRLLVPR